MTTPRIDSGKLGELASTPDGRGAETVVTVKDLSVTYSGNLALDDVTLDIQKNFVTAFIGPSGCGKSTFIRCFNRMNDLVPGAVVSGEVLYHDRDLYGSNVDASGAGRFFHDFSYAAVGRHRAGAGRTVTLASFQLGRTTGSGWRRS